MILMVRHGESTWNAEHRWAGQADPPLTANGRTGAHQLAERLCDRSITGVDGRLVSAEVAAP